MTALWPDVPLWLTLVSIAYPAYYLVESLWLTFRSRGESVPGRVPETAV
jgi:hypothetical protein